MNYFSLENGILTERSREIKFGWIAQYTYCFAELENNQTKTIKMIKTSNSNVANTIEFPCHFGSFKNAAKEQWIRSRL